MRAISIERARRTVMEATTSSRASFSLTLLRTISRGDADMAFLRGDCPLLYARGHEGIRGPVGPGRDPLRYCNSGRAAPRRDEISLALVYVCRIATPPHTPRSPPMHNLAAPA